MAKLSVNIDHVATLREARKGNEPDPIMAAILAELAGADGITIHLREDRRHINDRDLYLLKETVKTKLNLEMANTKEIIDIACKLKPDQVTLVPEKREEITTEGGLDIVSKADEVAKGINKFHNTGIMVSLFIDPEEKQVKMAKSLGADIVEINTGRYSVYYKSPQERDELKNIKIAVNTANEVGLIINAGHGLNYKNIINIARENKVINEYNIGHSIISRAVLTGMEKAVRDMIAVILSV